MKIKKIEKDENSYMKDYVYKVLKKNIMELRLVPGVNLNKKEIVEELEVSRTPIRDALVKLKEDGLVDIYPQRGTYVSHIDLEKVDQARFMREHLERAVVKSLCKHITKSDLFELQTNVKMQEICSEELDYIKSFELDKDFHKILFQSCNKNDIWLSIQQISSHLDRLRVLSLVADFNRSSIISDHQQIVDALKAKDEELVDNIMKKHLRRAKFDTKKLKEEYPSYFGIEG